MKSSRRRFITSVAAGSALVGMAATGSALAQDKKPACPMVGACGLSCNACPLMKAGKCKGCGSGKSEIAKKKSCPVAKCASKKGIEFCGTGCGAFTKCGKIIGKPYAKEFIAGIKKRLA